MKDKKKKRKESIVLILTVCSGLYSMSAVISSVTSIDRLCNNLQAWAYLWFNDMWFIPRMFGLECNNNQPHLEQIIQFSALYLIKAEVARENRDPKTTKVVKWNDFRGLPNLNTLQMWTCERTVLSSLGFTVTLWQIRGTAELLLFFLLFSLNCSGEEHSFYPLKIKSHSATNCFSILIKMQKVLFSKIICEHYSMTDKICWPQVHKTHLNSQYKQGQNKQQQYTALF